MSDIPPLVMKAQSRRRAAALLEVLGVFLAGQLVVALLMRSLGLHFANPLANLTVGITNTELITLARRLFVGLMLQYSGYFLLIIPINWWHRRRGLAAYGLTKAGRSWTWLVLAGAATAALAAWPVLSVGIVNAIHPFGETVPFRQAVLDMSWRRWEFWLFSGVTSWALIPIVEELFFRGYCQRRLAEDWGNGAAIIGTACLFTFSHSQYHIANAYNAGMIAGVFILALGFGVVFAWTRSIVPSIVAHAIIDVPMTLPWQVVLLAAFTVGALFVWRRGVLVVKEVFSNASVVLCVALAIVGTAYPIASERFESLVVLAAGMVVLAVGLEVMDLRRDQEAEPASTSA